MVYSNDFLQGNLGRFWYFDVSKWPGEKNPIFQGSAKLVCFPVWLGQSALKGRVLTFFFKRCQPCYTSPQFGWPKLSSNECNQYLWFLGPPVTKNNPKMAQNTSLSGHFGPFSFFLGPGGPKISQILSALIRTGLRQPKLRRCITWLTLFVKES